MQCSRNYWHCFLNLLHKQWIVIKIQLTQFNNQPCTTFCSSFLKHLSQSYTYMVIMMKNSRNMHKFPFPSTPQNKFLLAMWMKNIFLSSVITRDSRFVASTIDLPIQYFTYIFLLLWVYLNEKSPFPFFFFFANIIAVVLPFFCKWLLKESARGDCVDDCWEVDMPFLPFPSH